MVRKQLGYYLYFFIREVVQKIQDDKILLDKGIEYSGLSLEEIKKLIE